ncbi:MAG: hypothetical protein WA667_22660, partial [Candidatus Nitrosopolaris sp.]
QYLQGKVEYLRNEINMLELEKAKSTIDILKLNRIIHEFRETENTLYRKREETATINQDLGRTAATRLYYDLQSAGLVPWLDREVLLPGTAKLPGWYNITFNPIIVRFKRGFEPGRFDGPILF